MPFPRQRLEAFCARGFADQFQAVKRVAWIAAFAQQLARIVAPFSGIGQRYFRIGTDDKELLFFLESKFKAKGLVAFYRNMQEKTVPISYLIWFILYSRGFDGFVRQHPYTPIMAKPYPQYTPISRWKGVDWTGGN